MSSLATVSSQRQPVPFTVAHRLTTPQAALADEKVLGVFCYGAVSNGFDDPRLLQVPLECLSGPGHADVLQSAERVTRGRKDGFAFAHNTQAMLAQLRVEPPATGGIEAQAFEAYQRIHQFLGELGFTHPLRVWNYIEDINVGEGDTENYKRFCVGRGRALQAVRDTEHDYPAASAIGHHGGNGALIIHLLAAHSPGIQVENPRQVSAFHYPRQYGVRSPSFSRARLIHWPRMSHLYLSGTASVVGHETRYPGDCRAQLMESLRNISSVVESASTSGAGDVRFDNEHLKLMHVYLRNRDDLDTARACIESHFGKDILVTYLLGDICRRDLLIEVDGLYCNPA
jgi:chorismate lyase/3-hydroxybenzoate synthase